MDAGGSNPARLTDNVGFNGQAVWSPDGGRIAFRCGGDICTINTDGTNFVRLPSDPLEAPNRPYGLDPALAVMETGGAVSRIAAGISGLPPAWSPDGGRLAFVGGTPSWYSGRCYLDEGQAHPADDFCMAMYDIYVVNADGTGLTAIASGGNPDWFAPLPGRPIAMFTSQCDGSTCHFDASASFDLDGGITSYVWQFGDGTSGSGAIANHTYSTGRSYTVTLTVTDDAATPGLVRRNIYANAPPVASFTVVCTGPTCTFNALGSSDPDGAVTTYFWNFGDTHNGYGPTPTHVYGTGTFAATLFVVDDGGAWDIQSQSITVGNSPPVASFTSACSLLTCSFNASGSSDADGSIASYAWNFGDGTTGSGANSEPHVRDGRRPQRHAGRHG